MTLTRTQLELVVQKKKVDEVYKWFRDHFVNSSTQQYIARCPFLVIQGPTGCGKTSTIRFVANQIGIPILEFSETSDLIHIDFGMREDTNPRDIDDKNRSWDRRKALRFQRFVEEKARFVPLSDQEPIAPSADSEFDIETDEEMTYPSLKGNSKEKKPCGIIILVEEALSFFRSQKLLMSTMTTILKSLREMASYGPRRAAIVFENFDSEREIVSLPNKFKVALGLEIIKFNPITRANMKKFIEFKLRYYQNIALDKNTVEALINDCDGDLNACLNSLQLMDVKLENQWNVITNLNNGSLTTMRSFQNNKRQRLNPDRFKLNADLMRDVTRSCEFFHLLGKIFYQKRLYPDCPSIATKKHRPIERPYAPENSTEYLSSRLPINPGTLLVWLHQHFLQFCGPTNINKAALFLDYLSDTDTISIDSLQSSQFYEIRPIIDQQQINLALEFTNFTLYEDQSATKKTSHRKVHTEKGSFIVKPSVESSSSSGGFGDLYSFKRPDCFILFKVVEDRQRILRHLTDRVMKDELSRTDPSKVIMDYLPYLSAMSDISAGMPNHSQTNGFTNHTQMTIDNNGAQELIKILVSLEQDPASLGNEEYAVKHEKLSEIVDRIEEETKIKTKGGGVEEDEQPMES